MQKQRLELDWVGKDQELHLEPRILLKNDDLACGSSAENFVIHGDNLLGLRALEPDFSEKIKCCYIDPPFNTDQAFEHYDDGIEHSLWLSLMSHRLRIIHRLLSKDGTLFVHIDDNNIGYLIVLLDEIFGRKNRLYIVTFKQGSATGHKAINPGCVSTTNFILLYAKDKTLWKPNRIYTARNERDSRYGQFIENISSPHTKWKFTTLMKAFAASQNLPEKGARALVKTDPNVLDSFVMKNAKSVIRFARPDYKNVGAETKSAIDASKKKPNEIIRVVREGHSDIFLKGGERILFYSDKLKLIDGELVAGEPLTTLWDDLLSNNLHAEGGIDFPKGKKPEALIKRCLDLASKEGDWVLDSFAGSGTTAAVAHKMRRKWITIELGEQARTHVFPRLKSVVEGRDESGITKAVDWQGGSGFTFYTLAPSLLLKDARGNWIISPKYDAHQLAHAVCKHEGFKYWPDSKAYWKQGHSSEKDFIFITTEFLTSEILDKIASQMKPDETLLICAKAFRASKTKYPNITIKKIPQMLLGRCEFGRDDYSLNVKEPTQEEMGL